MLRSWGSSRRALRRTGLVRRVGWGVLRALNVIAAAVLLTWLDTFVALGVLAWVIVLAAVVHTALPVTVRLAQLLGFGAVAYTVGSPLDRTEYVIELVGSLLPRQARRRYTDEMYANARTLERMRLPIPQGERQRRMRRDLLRGAPRTIVGAVFSSDAKASSAKGAGPS
ncbi:hypothetical protein EV193_104175 [Herbihabitans rhizosphaerae]|uniref:Uncharacterized protein n=1 Tax=Herbihabitans rhizosphaerae TaxID=1872711 RepID=A0A4Q7KR45_9PSEU|nr:hypothetical protein [Herbihabitans rhizosphaerae]RZS38964.1 hypothetical protein EV193_104175 [Herbihabitans rhizosphaerae]